MLTYFSLFVVMAESRSKFTEAARAAHKGKAIAGATSPPVKCTRPTEEVIILPSPPPPLMVEESTHSQIESSTLGAFASAPASELLAATPTPTEPAPASVESNLPGLQASSAWHWC